MSPPRSTPSPLLRKRKLSEISGLQVDKPVKKSRYTDQEEETNLWTTVKEYLLSPDGRPQPSVACPICLVPVAIRGVPILEPCPWKLADGSQKVGAVLPCAHIICGECHNKYMGDQDELLPRRLRTCPLCRAGLQFPECVHTVPSQRMPIATGEDSSMVPLTMPELQPNCEQLFPSFCQDCTTDIAEHDIDVSMTFISEVIHGVAYIPGEGPREWEKLVEATQELMWQYLQRRRATPSWRNGSVPAKLLQVRFAEEAALLPQLSDAHQSDTIFYPVEGGPVWSVPVHRGDGPQ